MGRARRSGGAFGKVVLGFALGVLAVGGAGFVYFKWKRPPVAPVNKPLFTNKPIPSPAHKPHPEGEQRKAPFGISEDVFEAGAHVYKARCASCHGTPGRDAVPTGNLKPVASQLLKHGRTSQPPGQIYARVAEGVPGTGMPAYRHVLSETAMWQVSLLLANADKPLPEPVMRILTAPSRSVADADSLRE